MPGILGLFITLGLLALIVWFIFWMLDQIPIPPTPKIIVKCVVGLIVVLYLLGMLAGAAPYPAIFIR